MSKKRFAPKLKIKKGDKVQVISGAYRGSEGQVLEIQPLKNRAIVDGVNVMKKHKKPVNNEPGGIHDINTPIHLSNLMLIDPKGGEPTRVGRKVVDGKLQRYSKKSEEIIR